MLTSQQVTLLNEAVLQKSLKDLKETLYKIKEEDLPEAYIRVAYAICPPSKRDPSKFNLEKLAEVWENFGIDEKHIKGVVKEMERLLKA